MGRTMRVAIAGAGVAGGIIASGLAAIPGLEVIAFERVGRDDHLLAGNGLNVGPNALRSAAAFMPDLAARLVAASLPWRAWTTWNMTGAPLYRIPLAEVADRDGIRIRWAELYRVCREAAARVLRYDTACADVRLDANGGRLAIAIVERDGRQTWIDDIDLLIVAEGRFSELRAKLCGAAQVQQLGIANFRCLIDDGGATGIDDFEQWYNGPNRLIAFRLADKSIYLSGNFPIDPGADIAAAEKTATFLRNAYMPAQGVMANAPRLLVDATCRDLAALHWSRAQEGDACWHDASARVLFPGDAGHPIAPTLGQGATLAIEDAAVFVARFEAAWAAAGAALDVPQLVRDYAVERVGSPGTELEFAL